MLVLKKLRMSLWKFKKTKEDKTTLKMKLSVIVI